MTTQVKAKTIPPWTDRNRESTSGLWILKKGREFVTISKSEINKNNFYLQKDKDRKLIIDSLQARLTFHQLIDFGYKLQN